ncbi:MAG TPA: hypothetical protein VGJ18_02725 [Gemmatimonadaceae bacterium]|jgi:hypothetical protein
MTPGALPDPLAVALFVGRLLEKLRATYLVGGSFASSLHGEPRSTNDVDIVADLDPATAGSFVDSLGQAFYADASAAIEAAQSGTSFNIVHIETAVKVDIFVAGADPFDRARLQRRQRVAIDARNGKDAIYVDTAEDVVLRKLEWYRRGGETSERQWRDVVAVLRVQHDLDDAHLRTWAERLGIADLLIRARAEAKGR